MLCELYVYHFILYSFVFVLVLFIIDVREKANITRKVLYYTNVANICPTKCTKNSNKSNQFALSMIVIINLGIHKGYLMSQQECCLWRSCCSILGLLCSFLWITLLPCFVCRSSTYDSRLPLWILQTFLLCHSLQEYILLLANPYFAIYSDEGNLKTIII